MNYDKFLASKSVMAQAHGITVEDSQISPVLFPFQRDVVKWACHKGRAALFLDTGMGKTICQCMWAKLINMRTLFVAPLAVTHQTIREARDKLDMEIVFARNQLMAGQAQFVITNYENLDKFDASLFEAVVLDESSLLKSMTGKIRKQLIRMFSQTPYRLCCTATPAPNDIVEIGNHAEFLGVMSSVEMMSIFFTYNSNVREGKHRLKNYGKEAFYRWMASWAASIRKPSDLGYPNDGYILPELNLQTLTFKGDFVPEGMLFSVAISSADLGKSRRQFMDKRIETTLSLVNGSDEQWLVWVHLNEEGERLEKLIPNSVNVYGAMSPEEKTAELLKFVDGQTRVLITKGSIAGFGMNFQHCHNVLFFGLDYSWESYYQQIRRVWRYGQTKPVNVYIALATGEDEILNTILRKEREAVKMSDELIKASHVYTMEEIRQDYIQEWKYRKDKYLAESGRYELWLGDSVELMQDIPDESVDLSVYSPPFSDIFVYSATERDLGNNRTPEDFFQHYDFIIRENLRITKPGRLCCVHVADGRALNMKDGYIGRKDFSGDVIEAYERAGWIFWQRITIWKNPQVQAIRLYDNGLKFKTLEKDSTRLSGGHADYVLVFQKEGKNQVPVLPLDNGEMNNDDWILWAAPVWYDINETDTLNERVARNNEDEKHMCPLQLPLIDRCIRLWSNPKELIFSPFAGIGSEIYQAILRGRKGLGIELKPEYWKVAIQNCENAESMLAPTLWEYAAQQKEGMEK